MDSLLLISWGQMTLYTPQGSQAEGVQSSTVQVKITGSTKEPVQFFFFFFLGGGWLFHAHEAA